MNNEVKIGNQVWMTENLGVDYFRNGDAIPIAKTDEEWKKAGENKQPAWCYYQNDLTNGAKYGKLYNCYAVNDPRCLAPEGWHVPSDNEWKTLTNYLGGEDFARIKMKSTSGWKDTGNGTNVSGFNALPGGRRNNYGTFDFIGKYCYWWCSTEVNIYSAFCRTLHTSLGFANIFSGEGLSVRCLRD